RSGLVRQPPMRPEKAGSYAAKITVAQRRFATRKPDRTAASEPDISHSKPPGAGNASRRHDQRRLEATRQRFTVAQRRFATRKPDRTAASEPDISHSEPPAAGTPAADKKPLSRSGDSRHAS